MAKRMVALVLVAALLMGVSFASESGGFLSWLGKFTGLAVAPKVTTTVAYTCRSSGTLYRVCSNSPLSGYSASSLTCPKGQRCYQRTIATTTIRPATTTVRPVTTTIAPRPANNTTNASATVPKPANKTTTTVRVPVAANNTTSANQTIRPASNATIPVNQTVRPTNSSNVTGQTAAPVNSTNSSGASRNSTTTVVPLQANSSCASDSGFYRSCSSGDLTRYGYLRQPSRACAFGICWQKPR